MSEERLKEIRSNINYLSGLDYDVKDELELYNEVIRLKTKTKEQSLLLIDYQDMEQKLEKYKSRIDKATEYIENTPLYETTYDYNIEELEIQNVSDETASNKLLNILRGKDE